MARPIRPRHLRAAAVGLLAIAAGTGLVAYHSSADDADAVTPAPGPDGPPALSRADIDIIERNLIGPGPGAGGGDRELLQYGERAFPIYLSALTKDDREYVWRRVHVMIADSGGDKRMFRDIVLEHLGHGNGHLRSLAAQNLYGACPESYAQIAIGLLADDHWPVVRIACKHLAAHGGEDELAAFDIWLRTHERFMKEQRNEAFEKMVRGYRDELYVRSRHR